MKTSTFEQQEDESLLITCNDVVDHPDQGPYLAEYVERLAEGSVKVTKCQMVNDGEAQLEVVITPKRKKRDRIEQPSNELPTPPETAPPNPEPQPQRAHHNKGR